MPRLIDADKLLDILDVMIVGHKTASDVFDVVEDMPTVDAEPVRYGHWEVWFENEETRQVKCSECRMMFTVGKGRDGNYCPNCGAKMDESKGETKKRKQDDGNLISNRKCSECLHAQNITGLRIYCHDCGAKMDEVEE